MKKILLSGISLTVISGSALAADLTVRNQSYAAPITSPTWQGFYAGLNAGYGFGTANNAQNSGWANVNPGGLLTGYVNQAAFAGVNSFMGQSINQAGFIGGGQLGYNYQYVQNFILGFETDIQGAGISGQGNVSGWAPYQQTSYQTNAYLANGIVQAGVNWMGTARGRIGYLISPSTFLYATGGLAYGGTYLKTFPSTSSVTTAEVGSFTNITWTQNGQQKFNVGWGAGAGAEWMIDQSWSLKTEALYYNLGNSTVNNTAFLPYALRASSNPIGGSTTRTFYQGVIARIGLNYHLTQIANQQDAFYNPILMNDSIAYKKVYYPPVWEGFYAGLSAGYGFGTANNAQNSGWANVNPNGLLRNSVEQAAFAGVNSFMGQSINQAGFIGGGQLGYNYQYVQNFILGFETDIQGAGISGQGNVSGWAPYQQTSNETNAYLANGIVQAGVNWMGTARGRIGYLISPSTFLYATGGLAYGGTYLKTFPNTFYTTTSLGGEADLNYNWTQNSMQDFNVGWTAGGGAEWMLVQNWSVKAEALYYDLGNTTVNNTAYKSSSEGNFAASNPAGGSTTRAYYQGVIARVGVNYHFNLGTTPIVAKF